MYTPVSGSSSDLPLGIARRLECPKHMCNCVYVGTVLTGQGLAQRGQGRRMATLNHSDFFFLYFFYVWKMFPRRNLKKLARDARRVMWFHFFFAPRSTMHSNLLQISERSDGPDRTGLRCHVVMRFFVVVFSEKRFTSGPSRDVGTFLRLPLDKCDH